MTAQPTDTWNPDQYGRFHDERAQPFLDLLSLVRPVPGGRVADLGCGPGELSRLLHERTQAAETTGVDASEAMLARAATHAGGGLAFEHGDIATWEPAAPLDIIFSNAALQWVGGHERLYPRLADLLAPGGQLAVQVPANHNHPSQTIARALAGEEPFASALTRPTTYSQTREPEWYSELLHRLGFEEQHVRVQIYPHVLKDARAVVEWIRGSLMTDYERRLPADLFAVFNRTYEDRVIAALPPGTPYLFTFRRLLLWGRKPGGDAR